MLRNMRRFLRQESGRHGKRLDSSVAKSRLDKPRRGVQTSVNKRNVGRPRRTFQHSLSTTFWADLSTEKSRRWMYWVLGLLDLEMEGENQNQSGQSL